MPIHAYETGHFGLRQGLFWPHFGLIGPKHTSFTVGGAVSQKGAEPPPSPPRLVCSMVLPKKKIAAPSTLASLTCEDLV